jgi:hypothetical protein
VVRCHQDPQSVEDLLELIAFIAFIAAEGIMIHGAQLGLFFQLA